MQNSNTRLKVFRESLGYSQAKIGLELGGIKQRTYANYEEPGTGIPSEVLEKLSGMGLNLNWLATGEGEMLQGYGMVPELQRATLTPAQQYVQSRMEPQVPRTLPEHIQQSYKIVMDAIRKGDGDSMKMDDQKIGLVIGLIAQEIALGKLEEARSALMQQAELLVGLKVHS